MKIELRNSEVNGDAGIALHAALRSIESDPTSSVAWHCAGLALFRLRRYEEALEKFSQAIRINPGFEVAYESRARLFLCLDQVEAAIEDLSRAIRLSPQRGVRPE